MDCLGDFAAAAKSDAVDSCDDRFLQLVEFAHHRIEAEGHAVRDALADRHAFLSLPLRREVGARTEASPGTGDEQHTRFGIFRHSGHRFPHVGDQLRVDAVENIGAV